jgi:hypothetical protein
VPYEYHRAIMMPGLLLNAVPLQPARWQGCCSARDAAAAHQIPTVVACRASFDAVKFV